MHPFQEFCKHAERNGFAVRWYRDVGGVVVAPSEAFPNPV